MQDVTKSMQIQHAREKGTSFGAHLELPPVGLCRKVKHCCSHPSTKHIKPLCEEQQRAGQQRAETSFQASTTPSQLPAPHFHFEMQQAFLSLPFTTTSTTICRPTNQPRVVSDQSVICSVNLLIVQA